MYEHLFWMRVRNYQNHYDNNQESRIFNHRKRDKCEEKTTQQSIRRKLEKEPMTGLQ